MAIKTPLQSVNELHGGKEKLVNKLMDVLEKGVEDAEVVRQRLLSASNKKLVRLLRVTETIRKKYGSAEKLAAAIANAIGKAKDVDYVRKLGEFSPAKLLDMAQTLEKRVGGALSGVAGAAKQATAKKKSAAAKPKAEGAAKGTAKAAKPAAKKAPAAAKKAPAKKK